VDCRRCRLICSLVITVVLEVREPNAGPHLGGDVLVALKQCPRKSPQFVAVCPHFSRAHVPKNKRHLLQIGSWTNATEVN
jgi:hypothetical protein